MSDRDIPSVPVTTLAGLTSLSDLLSELPVSDSLSNVNSLNKSLLFHTLVANESNNLLSVRDDNLVRQLVHAIEQTNSDNIEIKSQYEIPQHGANISTYPELLQGIYNFRPTVFNTPQAQHAEMQQQNQQHLQSQQTNRTPDDSGGVSNIMQHANINEQISGNNQEVGSSKELTVDTSTRRVRKNVVEHMQQEISPKMQHHEWEQQQQHHHQMAVNEGAVEIAQQQQQQQMLLQQQQLGQHNIIAAQQQNQMVIAPLQQQQQDSQHGTSTNAMPAATLQQQLDQTQQQALQQHSSVIQQSDLKQQSSVILKTPTSMPEHVQQQQQQHFAMQQQQQLPQNSKYYTDELYMDVDNNAQQQQLQLQQQNIQPQQPEPPSIQGNFQNVLMLQRQQQVQIQMQQQQQQQQQQMVLLQQIAMPNQMAHKATPRNNEFLLNQQPNINPSSQSPAQAAIAPEAHQQVVTATSTTTSTTTCVVLNHQNNNVPMVAATTAAAAAPGVAAPAMSTSNADASEQQQLQQMQTIASALATATHATEAHVSGSGGSNATGVQQQNDGVNSSSSALNIAGGSSSSSSVGKSQVRVCINRVKAADARLMQQSIKEFIQKSPEMAKKMGLPASAVDNAVAAAATTTTTTSSAVSSSDTFSIMKADEKRVTAKRRMVVPLDDIPPEQIFSKPKVRRVERVTTPIVKCSKEEVMRSQTYQQFMRNMDQIIELLDDTETPNFDSDEVDENIECISSKMLNTMSNDVAKLKAKHVLDSIPKNKLTLLINYAMRNVYLAKNYSAGPDDEDDIVDDEIMEKILNAIEACLLICNIYSTAKDLKFLQEDNISLIIKFIQFQLRETIFPSYDAVYTVKSMKKTDNRRKTKNQQNHNRSLNLLYSKAVELMKVFVTLFDKCIFVDTIVLPLSTLAIEPFFVDNIETLQFVCLELVTTIFRKERYDKIRSSILGDILSSIDRLPSSKKNLRPFKLMNNGGNIQMVTALVLQLIQCATILPDALCEMGGAAAHKLKPITQQMIDIEDNIPGSATKISKQNHDVIVLKKYDVAISIGGNFLTTFLNKCKTRSNETDFRPLFENFIHDLLATVNKPEWPASELLVSLLGTMLVRYVSDKSIEQSIRLVSLDYLGIVAARLRKDSVESRCKVNIIDSMIKSIKAEQEKEGDLPIINNKLELDVEEERTEFLQKILLDFLAVNAQEENLIWDYARHFYLAQWYRDIIYQRRRLSDGNKGYASRKKSTARKKRRKGGSSASSDSNSSDDSDDASNPAKNGGSTRNSNVTDQELNVEIFNALEERKRYLLSNIRPYATAVTDLSSHSSAQHIKTYIDYNNAHLIAQYLANKRPFSQSFDGYLKKIILVVNEPSIAVRTRAMKCLANIVEVDPMVLKRKDMQMGVNQKFLDAAISVREAAVDLVGKFVLSNEELIDQYYDMLSTRILDTGVSVRKRVIKILRDICIEYPDFEKIPEICVKMIRRVNDEEGIQKLVTEVFMKMWFTPCQKNDQHGIQRKINQIIDVVNTAHDTGTTWLEGLLTSIFQPKENMMKLDGSIQEPVKKNTEPPQEIVLACQQLADGLVDRLIELEDTDNARMLGCITTLHLLAKVRPQLLVRHAITIEPYLNIKCHPSTAPKFICAVADILEKVVPLVNYASESFLASLEEHLMLLVVSYNQAVVTSCVSCLGALVNKITKNYKLIRDCFQKFYRILENSRNQLMQNIHCIKVIYTPMFRRSLFTIGILMRYFDFKSQHVIGGTSGGNLPISICDDVFECLMYFIQCANHEIRKQALIALGSFCVMNDDYLTRSELKNYYCDLLRATAIEPSIKIICMRNIWIYLTESEMYMHNKEKEWEKQSKTDDLKEMNDVSSGMASRIIQLYLEEILDCFLNSDDAVRLWAVKVVQIVLRQGLVHPVRMVPYLICLSTDSKLESAHRADALLKEIDKTYAGFVNMKVQFGLQLCFKLQEILQCNKTAAKGSSNNGANIIRGYVKRDTDHMPSALNDFLYTLLRTTKPQRRALVQAVTKQFDDQKTSLRQMLYIADNLAYFPYVVQDEPLYLIHQIDLLISMAGTNLLATFKECLKPNENATDVLEDDDDEEDPDVLFKRLPEKTDEIQKCITSAQACMLLLILKEHLKEMYSLTDGKISRYSPSEQKIYEKAVTRKNVPDFNPKTTIDIILKQQEQNFANDDSDCDVVKLNDAEKMDLVLRYLDFKKLMLKLDPDDADTDEDKAKLNSTISAGAESTSTATTSFLNSTAELNQTLDHSNISGAGGGAGASSGASNAMYSSPNLNNSSSMNYSSNVTHAFKDVPDTPTSRVVAHTKFTATATKTTSARKQPQRGKRKKRKAISSDEEDEDYSEDDYV